MDSQDHDPGQNDSREPPKDITSYGMGTGRSYECVFCERGFTTAQALGGHMNIHRKERATPKPKLPSSESLNSQSKIPTIFPACRQISRKATPPNGHQLTSQVDLHQFLIPNSSAFSPNPRFLTDAAQNGFLSTCCKESCCGAAGLGLHIGAPSSHVVEEIGKRRSSSQGGFNVHQQAVEELDLELRLGLGLNPEPS